MVSLKEILERRRELARQNALKRRSFLEISERRRQESLKRIRGDRRGGSAGPSVTPPSEPVIVDKKTFVGPVAEKKLPAILSRATGIKTILGSKELSGAEKATRVRKLLSGKPVPRSKSSIEKLGELSKPTFKSVTSSITQSERNVQTSIDLLKQPDTWYAAGRNVVVRDEAIASRPDVKGTTKLKIDELEKVKLKLGEQKTIIEGYEDEGYKIRKNPKTDMIEFFKTGEQLQGEQIEQKVKEIKALSKKGVGGKAAAVAALTTASLLSFEDPFAIKSIAQQAMGDREAALRTKAKAIIGLDVALEAGVVPFAFEAFTGPLATVGFAFPVGAGVATVTGKAIGFTTAKQLAATGTKAALLKAAPLVIKGTEIGVGIGFGALATQDVIKTAEKDPLLGFAKGITFLGAAISGVKGFKSVDRAALIGKGEAKFFAEHPERIRLVFGKEGKPVEKFSFKKFFERTTPAKETKRVPRTRTLADVLAAEKEIKKTPQFTKLTKAQRTFTKEFAKDPTKFKLDTTRTLSDVLGDTKFVETVKAKPKEFTVKRFFDFSPKGVKTSKVDIFKIDLFKPGKRVVALSEGLAAKEAGPRLDFSKVLSTKIKGFGISGEAGKVKTTPLLEQFELIVGKAKTGVKGKLVKRIKTFDFGEVAQRENIFPETITGVIAGEKVPPITFKGSSFKGKIFDPLTGKFVTDVKAEAALVSRTGFKPTIETVTIAGSDVKPPIFFQEPSTVTVPVFGTGLRSGLEIEPIVITTPVVKQDVKPVFELKADQEVRDVVISDFMKDVRSGTKRDVVSLNIFDTEQERDIDLEFMSLQMQKQRQEQRQELALFEETEQVQRRQKLVFDPFEDVFADPRTSIAVGPGADIGFDLTAPIFRKRTFRTGDLGKELKKFTEGFAL